MSDQEGEQTHDGERQQPLGVIPLVIQKHDAGKRRRSHDQDLWKAANTETYQSERSARSSILSVTGWNPSILTFPRNSTKSPTALIVATRRAFSTKMTKASRADVQKLVLLIAVAA